MSHMRFLGGVQGGTRLLHYRICAMSKAASKAVVGTPREAASKAASKDAWGTSSGRAGCGNLGGAELGKREPSRGKRVGERDGANGSPGMLHRLPCEDWFRCRPQGQVSPIQWRQDPSRDASATSATTAFSGTTAAISSERRLEKHM